MLLHLLFVHVRGVVELIRIQEELLDRESSQERNNFILSLKSGLFKGRRGNQKQFGVLSPAERAGSADLIPLLADLLLLEAGTVAELPTTSELGDICVSGTTNGAI